MPRKATPARSIGPDWFLAEWMQAKNIRTQAELGQLTGWGKARCHEVYHGKTEYYRVIVNEVARALELEPWMLFMPPADAYAVIHHRNEIKAEALRLVAEERRDFIPAELPAERLRMRKLN
jgi:hypothetical protein